jgi:branched-chain amino acid transport system permease protein
VSARTVAGALAFVAVVAAFAAAGPFLGGYWLAVVYQTLLAVGLAYGWNIISGYAGYFSFGQITFFGIGAYTTALLTTRAALDWRIAALAGGVLAVLVALPAGAIMLRLRGPFFSLGMLGLAQTARVLVASSDATGGGTGIYLTTPVTPLAVYEWTLAVTALAFVLTVAVDRSAFGLRLRALREDEQVAGTLGVAVTAAKIRAFLLSALVPGLLGGGYAAYLTLVDPPSVFSTRLELQAVVMTVFGGVGTLWGPLVGGVVMSQVSEQLWAGFPQAYLMIFGGLLVVFLIVLPRGLVPAIASRARSARGGGRPRFDGRAGGPPHPCGGVLDAPAGPVRSEA